MHKQYIQNTYLKQTTEHFRDEQIIKPISENEKQLSKNYEAIQDLVM